MEAQERELLATLDSLMAEETWLPADAASGARQETLGKGNSKRHALQYILRWVSL